MESIRDFKTIEEVSLLRRVAADKDFPDAFSKARLGFRKYEMRATSKEGEGRHQKPKNQNKNLLK